MNTSSEWQQIFPEQKGASEIHRGESVHQAAANEPSNTEWKAWG